MKKLNSLKNFSIDKKKVLVRVDFNVPISPEGTITDNSRIIAALPTIEYLLSKQCIIILMSHLGRPHGFSTHLSLKPIANELSLLLKRPVFMAPDCIGKKTSEMISTLELGDVLLLENLRFHEAEEKPEIDPSFTKQLAQYGEFYVNDAFGCAHRSHASIVDLPKAFPGKVAPGFLMEREIQFLGEALKNPSRPFLGIIGGAKISSKIGTLKALSDQVDQLAVGGGMAFTFLKAQGFAIGNSLVEDSYLEKAKEILEIFKAKKRALLLPVDVIIAEKCVDGAETKTILIAEGIPDGFIGLDIGPKTIDRFKEAINQAKTIFWNGPMGVYEISAFAQGTEMIAEGFAKSSALTIAGGGETVAALSNTPWKSQVSHISTGGGATLEYLELGSLPGIDALID